MVYRGVFFKLVWLPRVSVALLHAGSSLEAPGLSSCGALPVGS